MKFKSKFATPAPPALGLVHDSIIEPLAMKSLGGGRGSIAPHDRHFRRGGAADPDRTADNSGGISLWGRRRGTIWG